MTSINRTGLLLMALFILTAWKVKAQHQELNEKPRSLKNDSTHQLNQHSLIEAFSKGKVNGQFRYFFMATDNASGLSDYFAHALGAGLRYETAPFYHVQLTLSGSTVWNMASSDLSKPDPRSGQLNRYEIGLFELDHPGTHQAINRLEEANLTYTTRRGKLVAGKQLLNTPFINLQDGRMRPTLVEGLYGDLRITKKLKMEGGILYGLSPRGSSRFMGIGNSIGFFPAGVAMDGKKSGYPGHVFSRYIVQAGIKQEVGKHFQAQAWQFYADQLLYTSLLQLDYTGQLHKRYKLRLGMQSVQQCAAGNGGNSQITLAYIPAGSKSFTFGFMAGISSKHSDLSVSYNRITAQGRYLMPREWGRDPFYTFMPRERNEGLGDVHALVGKYTYTETRSGLRLSLAAGHVKTPDVKRYALNKYGLPSYAQANAEIRYNFKGSLKGLEAQALLVAKKRTGNDYGDMRYVINKNDMLLYNVVLNYYF